MNNNSQTSVWRVWHKQAAESKRRSTPLKVSKVRPRRRFESSLEMSECTKPRIWKEGFKKLKKELRSFPTEKRLLEVMMTNLEKEVKDLPPYTPFRFGSVHHKLFQNQTKTGWDTMLKGFLHKDWRKIQSEYLQFCKSKKDVNQWLNKVIRRIWQIAWKQWEDRNETKHNIRENNEQLQHSIQKLIDHIDVRLQQNENQQYDNMDKQRIESKNQRKEWLNHMIERLSISTEDELPITDKEWSAIKTWRMR